MAEVLCVCREVRLIREMAAARREELSDAVAIVSYDEKPGIQAIATTPPDLPPEPGKPAAFARDHEYQRHGTVSLRARIDRLTGHVNARGKDRRRSRDLIGCAERLDAGAPAQMAIKLTASVHHGFAIGARWGRAQFFSARAGPQPRTRSRAPATTGSTSSRRSARRKEKCGCR